jgi:mucin-19
MNSPYSENGRLRGPALPLWLGCLLACLLGLLPGQLSADSWTTLAGPTTGIGYRDGVAAAAWFLDPNGVCVDPVSEVIYVAEEANNVVRKITPDGIVSTFAGAARYNGFVDGPGSAARFASPRGIAVDSAGNLFLTDRHRIRKITPAGVVTTIAGSDALGSADGTGTAAQFNNPRAIAVDRSGVLYVADSNNHTVRKVTQSGVVTTLAGLAGAAGGTDGVGTSARFNSPAGIAVDPVGNVFVTSNNAVRKISASGVVSTFAGSHSVGGRTDGNGIVARFTAPWGLALDAAGNLYVADNDNGTLRKISSSGDVTTLAGTAGRFGFKAGTPGTGLFGDLRGVAVDGAGNIVVADGDNAAIRKVSPAGVVTSITGTGLIGIEDGLESLARFRTPTAITVDPSGNVYVADRLNYTIRKIAPGGLVSTICGTPQVGGGSSDGPAATTTISTVDGIVWAPDGSVYFSQSYEKIIRKITPSGELVTVAGTPNLAGSSDGTGSGASFQDPSSMAADGSGNVYVVDDRSVVRRITPAGLVTTIAGKYGVVLNVDGPASTALLDITGGITADASGNVYAGCRNGTVRKIAPSGEVSTVAAVPVAGLAMDAGGNLYIGRNEAGIIRKLTPSGVLSTIAGKDRELRDGSGSAVRFVAPAGVAFGPGNRLYVADPSARNIRVGQIETGPVQITGQPSNAAVRPGSPAQFAVFASGEEVITYQWRKNGTNITGATEAVLSLSSAQTADAGKYDVVVKNGVNSVTSNAAILTVSDVLPTPPALTSQPSSVRVTAGSSASFSVTATGTAPLSYQWRKGSLPVAGGTASVLAFAATEETDAGVYTVAVSNLAGTVVSGMASLTVDPLVRVAPTITSQPARQTVYPGISATFRVKATSSPLPTYQWLKGGVPIPGATGTEYTIPAVQAADQGSYGVQVVNSEGTVTSTAATLSLVPVTPPVVGLWSTYAGAPGGVGALNATGADARFAYLQGVAVDGAGTFYVADTANHAIRKITATGVVTTLAGSLGVSGFVNGTGSVARFTSPQGVAVVEGTVYVSDTGTHTIRKITAAGVVTTLAGSMLVPGSNDGTGTVAKFNKPLRLAADTSGNLLVADSLNHAIRKITPEGLVTTLTGGPAYVGSNDGTLATARFNRPSDIALDTDGNTYVLDAGNKTIRKIDTFGNVTLLAGSAGYSGTVDGTGSNARFDMPAAITVHAGTVYVSDKNRMRSVSAAGVVTTIAGSATSGYADDTGLAARFSGPQGLASAAGTLYVGDTGNSVLRRMVLASGTVATVAGASATGNLNGTSALARFNAPRGVAADAVGNVYVADAGNHVIRKIDRLGQVTTLAGVVGAAAFADGTGDVARLNAPQSVVVDPAGNLLVADTGNHAIRKVTPAGLVTTLAGAGGIPGSSDGLGTAARFWSPRSLAQDRAGNVYVADGRNFTVRKILPSGLVTTLAGSAGSAAQQDGTGSGARFLSPTAVAVAANGEVSVADGSAIRRISAAGAVTTIAGSANFSGNLDGQGTVTSFSSPQGLALDTAGNLYVADTFNHTIRKVDPSGTVTTHAGGPGLPGSADGSADAVRFAYPAGIALDANGNLFVADMDNAKIRLGALGNRSILLPLQPLSTTAVVGGTATFSVVATGPGPFSYQWRRAGVNIEGGTGTTYAITGLQASDAGLYDVVVGNSSGAVASYAAMLAVSLVPLTPVSFTVQPTSQKVAVGNTVQFQVGVSGTEPITYQWRKDGVALPGARSDSLLLPSVQALDGGSYDVVVSNPVGSGTSALAALKLDFGQLSVSITSQPPSQRVFPGASATFSVTAAGTPPLSYQWRKNGVAISGGTASSYTIASVQSADLGDYSVQVTGEQGEPVVSAAAPLSFDMTPPLGGSWMVLAGTAGGAGTLDGTGPAAQFNYPRGITVDAGSNLYVADTQNHTIRRITPTGVVTTLAGVPGSRGGENGEPLQSRFREPQGVAIDSGSNLYVADTGNHVIRKISASGVVSTFAGTMGTPGSNDGTGIAARFKQPARLVVDNAGNVFVTDTGNHTIRRITPGGVVSTFAGAGGLAGSTDEMAANARFNAPCDIALDGAENLYVVDAGNKAIRKITPGGTVMTVAGRAGFFGTNDGTADGARFGFPSALAADPTGNLWVFDGHRLRSVSNTGVVATVAGAFIPGATDASGINAEFFNPSGICQAPNGKLYIADTGNSVIRAADTAMNVSTFAGASSSGNAGGTTAAARFHSPRGVARDSVGNLYVADAGNHTIRRVTPSGVVTTFAGSGAPGSLDGAAGTAQFRAPEAVAVDAAGNVFVADTGNHTLRVISPVGLVSTLAGLAGVKGSADGLGPEARFYQPRGVALGPDGNIYLSDFGNFTLRKVTSAGRVSTFVGSAGASGNANGTAGAARLSGPGALALEGSGNLLFTDANAIRRVTPSGAVSTVAGRAGEVGAIDGAASIASFFAPQGLAVDAPGVIFVADTFNHTVRRIATDGTVSTLAGAAGASGSADGVGTAVRFAFPWGLCDDGYGNLVLTDLDNSKVRLGLLRDTPLAIRIQPVGATVFEGAPVTLLVGASGVGPLSYQWFKNGVAISGATAPQYSIANVRAPDVGQYSAVVGNIAGLVTSQSAEVKLSTEVPIPVQITGQPQNGIVAAGYAAVFAVTAEGSAPLRYQWRKNGTNIIGATSASYTIASVAPLDAGSYDVIVFNTSSLETSRPVTLTVNDVGNAPPVIVKQPANVSRYPGVPGIFTVGVTGAPPLAFQWRKAGVDIAGANASTLTVSGMLATDAGAYEVVVSNSVGAPVTSSVANFRFTDTPPPSGMWSSLAGAPGGPGSLDGSASDARFNSPHGVALDAAGNAYLADTRNHTIRKITPEGVVTTLAGAAGVSGALDGLGTLARFNAPQGVGVDALGNVYVADTGNHLIRKISPAGLVSTLAGFPTYVGSADGLGNTARFFFPVALASDSNGNLYVADRENHAVRLVTAEGLVTTLAGYAGNPGYRDGTSLEARFNRPGGIALRSLGGALFEIFVADTGNKIIRRITADGSVSTIAGAAGFAGTADGVAGAVRFGNPTGLACTAAGKAYIADGNRIRILDVTTGAVGTFAGGSAAGRDDSSLEASRFNGAQGLAVNAAGEVFVADTGNSTLRRILPLIDSVETFAGSASAGSDDGSGSAALFRNPGAAALDFAGNLYVADAGNHTIRKVTVSGVVTTLAGAPGESGCLDGPGAEARLSGPRGVALDAGGNLYVADSGNHLIRVISPAGNVSTYAGTAGLRGSLDGTRESARFAMPRGLAVDASGNLYVADTFNFCVRKITRTGLVSTLAGSPGAAGTADGSGGAARFASPVALALDAAGNVYVADLNAIRKVTPAGVVSTLAGDPVRPGSFDGRGRAAGFSSPQALALDPDGNLYIADTGNQLIRKMTPSGSVTTVAGSSGLAGSGEGVGTAVRFASPGGMATDSLGNLYVVDSDSAQVRVGILAATPLRIVSEPADSTTFLNRATVFQVSATGPAPLAYQWSKDGSPIPDATQPVYRTAVAEAAVAGTYTYSVTVTNAVGTVTSRSAVLSVDGNVPNPVVITSQPSDLSVVLGASGSLSVAVTGSTPFAYQWRKNNVPILGATSPQLVFAAVSAGDDAMYDVVVSNPNGPVTSGSARLTVTAPNPGAPMIGSQTTAQKVSPGASATFSVTALGTGPFTYQWRKNGTDIPGAADSSYTLPAVYASDAGLYQVQVSNAGGSSVSGPAELLLNVVPPASGIWSTLAGPSGVPGSLDSADRNTASFNYPRGMALQAGSLYIADTHNHTIRRISADGKVTTVAGAPGTPGSGNGSVALARFRSPQGVALDAAGNLYVADTGNHVIRKISVTGEVTTLAGTPGITGVQDGAAGVARFNGPQSLVVSASGTLFVADTGNSAIRRILSSGSVTTFAGNGGFAGYWDGDSLLAQFNKPGGIAIDASDTLYVADSGNKVVRKISPSASVTTVAGSVGFLNPLALASDAAGNLLVLDGNRVRAVSAAGEVLPRAGGVASGFADGTGAGVRFASPQGIVTDGAGGAYVADTSNSVVRRVDAAGVVTTFAGRAAAGAVDSEVPDSVRFRAPRGLAQDAQGNLYVADSGNHTVRKVANSGATSIFAGASGVAGDADGEASTARFNAPQAVALDAAGNLYVADTGNHVVRLISPTGQVSTFAGTPGVSGRTDATGSAARFLSPRGLAVDGSGNVYVADTGNFTIRRITPAGVVTTFAGGPGAPGSLDGGGSSARFIAPVAIALNASGNIVVADGSAIRAISPFGNVTTLAGVTGARGAFDGTGVNASFSAPQGVALDAAGNVYVADTYNQTIRKVSSGGVVTTLAGEAGMTGSAEGIGTVARFAFPAGILVDPLGNLCVTEWDSARVRLGTLVDTSLLIRTQPVNASVLEGRPASFSVTAAGRPPLTYQWRKDGEVIAGATASTLSLPSAQLADAGVYAVEVGDATGALTSRPAQLGVYTAEQLVVTIQTQPTPLSVVEGNFAQFSVTASSSLPLSYQWSRNGVAILGATSSTLLLPGAALSEAGTYSVVARHLYASTTSAPAELSVTARPPVVVPLAILSQPVGLSVTTGGVAVFNVNVFAPGGASFQWRKNGNAISGATSSFFTIVSAQAVDAGSYDVVVTSREGGSVTSTEAALVVTPAVPVGPPGAPTITRQPVSASIAAGNTAEFTVSATGEAPLRYQWRKGSAPIAGATGASLTLNGLRAADAGIYDVVVSNRAGSVTSAGATLTIANLLNITSQPAALTVAAGNYAFLSVQASGIAPITYQWRKDGQPLAGGTGSFYEIPVAEAVHAGSYDVVVANLGNSLTSTPAALTVQPGGSGQIALLVQPVSTGALLGGAASFAVSASGTAPISYQWRRNGVDIAGANGPVYAVSALQSRDVGSYDVEVGNGTGKLLSAKATMSVYTPLGITAQPVSVSVSTGSPATFSVAATGTAPVGYQWRKDGQNIAGGTQASYVIPAAEAKDVGSYDVVLTNPAGTALSHAASLGVGPKPVLVKGPAGGTVLAGGSLTLSVSATGDGVTYQWRRNGSNIPGATASVLTLRNLKAADAGRFDVVVANAYGAVSPAPAADVTVHVPVSFTRHPVGALLREGAAATLSVQAAGTAPLVYQWRRNGAPIPGATRFSYTLSNASSESAGTYDVVVINPAGALVSEAAQISVSVALGIVRQPTGASVTQGSAVNLSVLAKGAGELKYAWYKWRDTGAPELVGTLSTLSFPSAAPGDAGAYSVLVTGNGTPVFSDRVTVTVSGARGIAVLQQPEDESFAEGAAVSVRTVIDAGGGEVRETRYTLCALRNGAPVAMEVTGVVPETGVLDVPLRRVSAGGAYVVRFDRVYNDGGTATAVTQPFYLSVRGRTEAVGTYEGLLLDANGEGVPTDGAGARGCITVSVGRTGSVSGRVQYVEAGALAGAPSAALRVYVPVLRSFSGVLAPSPSDPLKLVANLRLGVGSQAGRQELALVLDLSSDEALLTATVTDRISLPSPEVSVSAATGLRRNLVAAGTLSAAYARAAGRYTLGAPGAAAGAGDNNAQLLVQVLPSGRALWASRLTGHSGSGSAGLTAPSASVLLAPLYEGRATVGATLLTTSALFGELRWARALDDGWDVSLGADRLEQARSRVSGSRGAGGFVAAYAADEFAAGTNLSGVRTLDFGGVLGCRIESTLLGTLFALDAPGLTFVSADPLAGGSLGFSWNVTVSSAGVVRTSGISLGGVTPPVLSLRLDKVRGEWSGSYVTGGVRRSLIGCVLDSPSSRGRGWFESGAAAGRWELRLGH